MLNLQVIVASTRPGRGGLGVAKWFMEHAATHAQFEARLCDLAEVSLPLLDEPHHPRLADYQHAHTKAWSATVAAADAFVLVTPEYNFGTPPALVNALDYLSQEWAYKPVAFVSYGGLSAGTRSVQMTKQIVTALRMMPIPEAVAIPFYTQYVKDGVFAPPEANAKTARAMMDELAKWANALKPMRAK